MFVSVGKPDLVGDARPQFASDWWSSSVSKQRPERPGPFIQLNQKKALGSTFSASNRHRPFN